MSDDRYICAYCLVDAHENCGKGGCKCECRTGKPLVMRHPGASTTDSSGELCKYGCGRQLKPGPGMASHYRLHEREAAERAAAKPLDPASVRSAVDAMRAESVTVIAGTVELSQSFVDEAREDREAAEREWLAPVRSAEPECDEIEITLAPFSQRARDVADTVAFLDREPAEDVVARALDLWAETTIAERDDVATIVRVVTKKRMAETS